MNVYIHRLGWIPIEACVCTDTDIFYARIYNMNGRELSSSIECSNETTTGKRNITHCLVSVSGTTVYERNHCFQGLGPWIIGNYLAASLHLYLPVNKSTIHTQRFLPPTSTSTSASASASASKKLSQADDSPSYYCLLPVWTD